MLFRPRHGSTGSLTLDAAETVWLTNELRAVDKVTYKQLYPALLARQLIPTKSDIPTWATTHMWREMDITGRAKIITAMGDDFPRTDVSKREVVKTIKMVGGSYAYNWDELQAAASQPDGRIDADRAISNRFNVENEVDFILAYGNAQFGLEGLLTLSGTRTYTLANKNAGGKTWGTLAAPNATGKEVAYDLMGFAEDVVDNSIGAITAVDIVLPIEAYGYAAQKEMSSLDTTKALAAALASPFINSIRPWYRCRASYSQGALSNDTMVAYPMDPMILAGVVPMEYTPQPVVQRNLEWTINAMAKCGGVVARYPYCVSKATGFGA